MTADTVDNPTDTIAAMLSGAYGAHVKLAAQNAVERAWGRAQMKPIHILDEINRALVREITAELTRRGAAIPADILAQVEAVLAILPKGSPA